MGQIAAAVLNAAGGRGQGRPPFEPGDFMPQEPDDSAAEPDVAAKARAVMMRFIR